MSNETSAHLAGVDWHPVRGGAGREMTREQLRAKIDTMEALDTVLSAIDDVSGVEFRPDEQALIDLDFSDREKASIAFAHAIPQQVVLAGLQAMQQALEQTLAKEPA